MRNKCLYCGKSLNLFSTSRLCKKCDTYLNVKFETCKANGSRALGQIRHGFKNPASYLTRYETIVSSIQDIEEIKKFKNINFDITINDVHTEISNMLQAYLDREIDKSYTHSNNPLSVLNKLNQIKKYLNECSINYPLFSELIDVQNKKITNIMDLNIINLNKTNDIDTSNWYFDIKKMKESEVYNAYCITKKTYQNKIIKDLHTLNNAIDLYNNRYNENAYKINPNKIEFKKIHCDYDYAYLYYNPYTKGGNITKTPFILHFDISNGGFLNENFGKIKYSCDGIMSEAFIRTHTPNKRKTIIIDCIFNNDELIIKSIKENESGKHKIKTIYKL